MKRTRIIAITLLSLFVIFAFAGCAAYKGKEKTFTANGIEITATDRFTLVEGEGKDFSLHSLSCQIIFSNIGEIANDTIDEYIDTFVSELEKTMTIKSGPTYENGAYIMELVTTEDGTTVCLYEMLIFNGEDAWLVSFGCEESEYEAHKPYITEWAKSIRFVG
ncbi:MAG: hypothetical protein J6A96_05160 [Clostridia bacterium]|nr:hypothetical protein [Clostridia bacterium]